MPVQINEIVITASVREQSQNTTSAPENASNDNNTTIVKACVEEVLRILKEKEER